MTIRRASLILSLVALATSGMRAQEMPAGKIGARMGRNTWAAFAGSDTDAVLAGDVARKAREVTNVLKAMRSAGLQIVAIQTCLPSRCRARRRARRAIRAVVAQS